MAAAASLALIIGVGLYFNQPPPLSKSIQAKAFANDIPAGSNKAYLSIGQWEETRFDNSANGTLAEEAGIKITKTADGQLVYHCRSGKKLVQVTIALKHLVADSIS
ncbi:hypothetical protein CS542_07665 [Pedobacter sp. IW39]|nr:hypothetical protein CS542_07665 [Pedobacter sp. IW39]